MAILKWARNAGSYRRCMALGNPRQNGCVEGLEDRLRDVSLYGTLLSSFQSALVLVSCGDDFIHVRPHSGMGRLTPAAVGRLAPPTGTFKDRPVMMAVDKQARVTKMPARMDAETRIDDAGCRDLRGG